MTENRHTMKNTLQRLQQQRNRILATTRRYHASNVRVFGSVVRGEERDDSDIDFLVDFLPGTTFLDQAGLIQSLSDELGCKVDVVSARALNKHIRQQILNEAIPL